MQGTISKVKAKWSGRKGAPVFQPFLDFLRLMKKGTQENPSAGFIFQAAPSIGLSVCLVAASIVPMAGGISVFSFDYDFIAFIFILAAGKFFSIISSLSTGSSFEGMGSGREAAFSIFSEPAFFIVISSLSLLSKKYSFQGLFNYPHYSGWLSLLIIIFSAAAIFALMLIEASRGPVDDPNTHLELTMIHEVMVLDNSGPDLAYINFSTGLKLLAFGSVICNLFIPAGISFIPALALYILILALQCMAVGTVESVFARLRLTHIPQFVLLANSIAIVLFVVVMQTVSSGGGLK